MRRFSRWLAIIFVLALTVRAIHTLAIGRSPFARLLVGDGKGYDAWAATIASGDWVGKETFYQAPLYPYALAVLYTGAGRDPMTIRWAQALLGALACVLLAVAGRRWLGERAGLVAGGILALYPPAVFFDGLVQKAALDNFLMCALLAVLGAYVASHRGAILFAAGMVLGLFALTRENALVFLVILAAWLPFHLSKRSLKERALAVGTLAAGVLLILIPVGLRNRAVGGDFLITTSQAGSNFFIGNHEGANGRYLPIRPDRETYEFERVDAKALAEQAAGHALTPGAVSSYWWSRSFSWIEAHPGDWIALLGKKVLITWNRAEVPDSESFEVYADHSAILQASSAVFGFGALLILAVPGMALGWRQRPRPTLLYLMLFGFSAAVAVFYVFARYRFPMVPILVLFAGAALVALYDAVASKRFVAPARPVLAAALVGVVLAVMPPVVPAAGSRRLAYVNLGIAAKDAGNDAAAARFQRQAIALAPRLAGPHRELAAALTAMGKTDEAAEELRTAVTLDPNYAPARDDLGALLSRRGDLAGAEREYLEAHRIDPKRPATLASLGAVALARGRAGEAADWYRKAIAAAPAEALFHYQLSIALTEQLQLDEAEAELLTTLRLDPGAAGARDDLGVLLARRGDLAGAERQFLEAYRIDPARPSTLFNLGGVAMSRRRFDDAAAWYRKALAAKPDYEDARRNLDLAVAELGVRPTQDR